MINHLQIEKIVNIIRKRRILRTGECTGEDYRIDSRYGFIYIMCDNMGIQLPNPCPPRKAFEIYEKFTGLGYDILCAHWFNKRVPKYAQNKKGIDDFDPEDMKWMRNYLSKREREAINSQYHEHIKGRETCCISTRDWYYVIEPDEFDSYNILLKMEIDGNEETFARIRERIEKRYER